jgi:hypothetical protein
MKSVIMLSVVMLSCDLFIDKLNAMVLSIVMLSVVMLNVVMLSVVEQSLVFTVNSGNVVNFLTLTHFTIITKLFSSRQVFLQTIQIVLGKSGALLRLALRLTPALVITEFLRLIIIK